MEKRSAFEYGTSSFVIYRMIPKKDKEAFMQLKIMLNRLTKKYDQSYIMNTTGSCEPLEINDEEDEILLTLWTYGLSDNYLDECSKGELKIRTREFELLSRADSTYPPDAAVAFSALFSDSGDHMDYLSCLNSDTVLIDDDGCLSEKTDTHLTRKEAARLIELLKRVRVEQTETLGSLN